MKPLPLPDADTAPYWNAVAGHRLICQCCTACGIYAFPPVPRCPECLAPQTMEWREMSGHGTVYAYTVMHMALVRGFEPPYIVAEVELAEQPGLRLTCNILDCAPANVRIGMPVVIAFEDRGAGVSIPQFRPAS